MNEQTSNYLGSCLSGCGGRIYDDFMFFKCSDCSADISKSVEIPSGTLELTPKQMKHILNRGEVELPGVDRDEIESFAIVRKGNTFKMNAKLNQSANKQPSRSGHNRIPCIIEKTILALPRKSCEDCPIKWEFDEQGYLSWEIARSLFDDYTKDSCFRDNDPICHDCSYLHVHPENNSTIAELYNCVEDTSIYSDDSVHSCEDCGHPIDSSYRSYLVSSNRIVNALAPCDCCEAPLIGVVGYCPFCGGLIYEFEAGFACFHSITGPCTFRMSKEFMEYFDMYPLREHAYALFDKGIQECCMVTGRRTYTRIRTYEGGKWSFEISERDILSSPLN